MNIHKESIKQYLPDAQDPIFEAPWMARAFALTVSLHHRGVFTWPQWSEHLADAIRSTYGDEGVGYYEIWLQALENLLRDQAVLDSTDYTDEIKRIQDTLATSDH
ncbi:MAG: nitrile hydratase accessory protein [Acidiferrobacterales bacterium]|nr:nitrile hydratase accessory protein [Acidiferrobacterales bacterium]